MASGRGTLQAYEKTSALNVVVVDSYPSVVRFIGHVQLTGVRPRTVDAYLMMVRLLALHAGQDPASLDEGSARVRHLLRAGEAVQKSPDKVELWFPGCGGLMRFLHALRPRARPPPMASLCA